MTPAGFAAPACVRSSTSPERVPRLDPGLPKRQMPHLTSPCAAAYSDRGAAVSQLRQAEAEPQVLGHRCGAETLRGSF
eukprot:4283012-Alexandrium_andersonii.AAC.1